jgi:hypothetical protein
MFISPRRSELKAISARRETRRRGCLRGWSRWLRRAPRSGVRLRDPRAGVQRSAFCLRIVKTRREPSGEEPARRPARPPS